jgi:sigma-54 specific flagellar transcriptional regulator A
MAQQDIELPRAGLPVKAPDLVLLEKPGGRWQVRSISAGLQGLLKVSFSEAQGRFVESLFPEAVPPLQDLARDAAERDLPLGNVRVRFFGQGSPVLAAEVLPAGLTEDFRSRVVTFHFARPPAEEDQEPQARYGMVGSSPALREVFRKIALYAPSDAAVVITGETGSGKELVARALHDHSLRNDGPYVAVNCSAISEELLESELFGHEKGAFTGALRSHRGRFERADGGTLFLDEIGDMPLHTQSKLLRVLEEGRIERVGAEGDKLVDVRIVAATNVQLEQAVGRGRFRADLYHRLSVLRMHLPPLRERPEDIPHLVAHFLRLFSRKYQRQVHRLTPEAMGLLRSYLWPGNVRELRNVLERVFVETQAEVIGARAFREWVRERQQFDPDQWGRLGGELQPRTAMVMPYPLTAPGDRPVKGEVVDAEYSQVSGRSRRSTVPLNLAPEAIRRAYRAADGNLAAAARLLGVHRASLYRYLKKLGLSRAELDR